MSEFKKLLFIVNKYSGSGYNPEHENLIESACKKRNIAFTLQSTSGRGNATELAKNGVGKYDAVVAIGGDGTVNEVAQGIVSTPMPIGIIPNGSGNGLARHLKIPLGIHESLDALFSNRIINMDTFRINGQLSLAVSGIGFDGHIANLFNKYHTRGFVGYAGLVLREYFRFAEFDWDLHSVNNSGHHKSFIVAIANTSQYGNNAYIAPSASVTDGLLNISILDKIPIHKGVHFTYQLFNKKLKKNTLFKTFTSKDMRLQTHVPVPYHIDGEPSGISDSFTISILPGSLKMIVPSTSQP